VKILIVDSYYPAFLDSVYINNLELSQQPYSQQWRTLMDQCFGTADYYSFNLQQLGHEATEIIANCEPLQRQWAKEYGLKVPDNQWTIRIRRGFIPWLQQAQHWVYAILAAQIKQYQPDVLHVQDMNAINSDFLRKVRPYVGLIVGQIAYSISPGADFSRYDLVLSSLPHYVQRFREQGLNSHLFRLGFEHTILSRLKKLETTYPVVHIGSYGAIHQERNELLEALLNRDIPLLCWGAGLHHLSATSLIRKCYQGEAWGLDMYNIRHNSKMVVSKHITSVADVHANIMTLYEATGVGAALVIDQRQDLSKLFEPGREIVAYRSVDECVDLIHYYLEHEDERAVIAQAGQARTLSEHTYYHRMQEFVEIVREYL
jgi:spore maturation protein CgeB